MEEQEFQVLLVRRAEKELEALPKPMQATVFRHVLGLSQNPRPQMAKPLKGAMKVWRLRVGNYRAIYEIHDEAKQVIVTQIGHRRDVYRGF